MKFKLNMLAAAIAGAISSGAMALPVGANVTNGIVSFSQTGNAATIKNTPGAIIEWKGYSIAKGESVNYVQQSASSAVLNRVMGADPSNIYGSLTSIGRVYLINPNGIVFGNTAKVDVGGLVASTLNISNADFLAGRDRFGVDAISNMKASDGKPHDVNIEAGATIKSAERAWFIAERAVTNNGHIEAKVAVLAAGKTAESVVVDSSLGQMVFKVGKGGTVTNNGDIVAPAVGLVAERVVKTVTTPGSADWSSFTGNGTDFASADNFTSVLKGGGTTGNVVINGGMSEYQVNTTRGILTLEPTAKLTAKVGANTNYSASVTLNDLGPVSFVDGVRSNMSAGLLLKDWSNPMATGAFVGYVVIKGVRGKLDGTTYNDPGTRYAAIQITNASGLAYEKLIPVPGQSNSATFSVSRDNGTLFANISINGKPVAKQALPSDIKPTFGVPQIWNAGSDTGAGSFKYAIKSFDLTTSSSVPTSREVVVNSPELRFEQSAIGSTDAPLLVARRNPSVRILNQQVLSDTQWTDLLNGALPESIIAAKLDKASSSHIQSIAETSLQENAMAAARALGVVEGGRNEFLTDGFQFVASDKYGAVIARPLDNKFVVAATSPSPMTMLNQLDTSMGLASRFAPLTSRISNIPTWGKAVMKGWSLPIEVGSAVALSFMQDKFVVPEMAKGLDRLRYSALAKYRVSPVRPIDIIYTGSGLGAVIANRASGESAVLKNARYVSNPQRPGQVIAFNPSGEPSTSDLPGTTVFQARDTTMNSFLESPISSIKNGFDIGSAWIGSAYDRASVRDIDLNTNSSPSVFLQAFRVGNLGTLRPLNSD